MASGKDKEQRSDEANHDQWPGLLGSVLGAVAGKPTKGSPSMEAAAEVGDFGVKEYGNYAAGKAGEGKERVVGRLSEWKDTAAETARRAVGFLSGKKVDIMQRAEAGTGEPPKDMFLDTESVARKKMEELRLEELRDHGVEPVDETAVREQAAKDAAADRGTAGRKNIYGAFGNMKEVIRSKLTMPTDIMEETRAARELGGSGRRANVELKVEADLDVGRVGAVDNLKHKAEDAVEQSKRVAEGRNRS